jgi:hypothetical protein
MRLRFGHTKESARTAQYKHITYVFPHFLRRGGLPGGATQFRIPIKAHASFTAACPMDINSCGHLFLLTASACTHSDTFGGLLDILQIEPLQSSSHAFVEPLVEGSQQKKVTDSRIAEALAY